MPLTHPFEPVWTPASTILILGTFPSVASRKQGFYYGHPRNRFWALVSALFAEPLPDSIDAKKELLLRHQIALWDVLASCEITNSGDASIRRPVPNELAKLVAQSAVAQVFCNGKKAHDLYRRHGDCALPALGLPSTSPANAAWNFGRLLEAWRVIAERDRAGN